MYFIPFRELLVRLFSWKIKEELYNYIDDIFEIDLSSLSMVTFTTMYVLGMFCFDYISTYLKFALY